MAELKKELRDQRVEVADIFCQDYAQCDPLDLTSAPKSSKPTSSSSSSPLVVGHYEEQLDDGDHHREGRARDNRGRETEKGTMMKERRRIHYC